MPSTKLNLKHTYQLTINPVIHSLIGFLPLNRVEFIEKIRNEVESNPMLELNRSSADKTTGPGPVIGEVERRLEKENFKDRGFLRKNDDRLDKNRAIELFTANSVSLAEHLIQQAMSQFDDKELEIAHYIIYNLNSDGYLDVEIESIASLLLTTPVEIERIRCIIKTFDPLGVASRSLKECLISQVEGGEESDRLRRLIENHLEDLSKGKYNEIMKSLEVSREEINQLIAHLKRLRPKPGADFERENVDYAEIDLLLVKEGNEYTIKYIDEGIPRMVLSSYYEQMLKQAQDKETKSYLKEKFHNANLIIEGINLRKSMIVQIAEVLIKKQQDFLDFGEKWKKPLTMKEVASELNYNESTISRAVSNKYIATDKGLINMRSFFSYGIKGDFGFKHSVETIRDKIKKIIDEEPHDSPLSDLDIEMKLADLGIKISRRTIRNYRDEMHIPTSSRRREQYALKNS